MSAGFILVSKKHCYAKRNNCKQLQINEKYT